MDTEKTMEGNTKIKMYLCIFEIFHGQNKKFLNNDPWGWDSR